jgi:O-methyltransferase
MSDTNTQTQDQSAKPIGIEQITHAYKTIRLQEPWHQLETPSIKHHRVLPHATYSPWLTDAGFMATYEKIRNHTLVDIYRCYELWLVARQLDNVEGNFLEVGVWRGGTGALLAEAGRNVPGRKIFLADTFTGVVKAGENDTRYKGGEHADTSEDLVLALLASMNLSNATTLKGIFPEDTQAKVAGKIAMLHCDVDVYSSTKDIVEWCLPRFVSGSVVVFDDYGFSGCEGVTKFCQEFRKNTDFFFLHNLNGHAVFIKK